MARICTPETYWQLDAPGKGHAVFQIAGDGRPPQSILGLPLMNNYYMLFDRYRSVDSNGVIHFAAIQPAARPAVTSNGR